MKKAESIAQALGILSKALPIPKPTTFKYKDLDQLESLCIEFWGIVSITELMKTDK